MLQPTEVKEFINVFLDKIADYLSPDLSHLERWDIKEAAILCSHRLTQDGKVTNKIIALFHQIDATLELIDTL